MGMGRLSVPLALLLVAGLARAHGAALSYTPARRTQAEAPAARLRPTPTAGRQSLLLPAGAAGDGAVSQAELDARRPAREVGLWDALPLTAGGAPCTRKEHAARLRETYVELAATFACPPGRLRQTYTVVSLL